MHDIKHLPYTQCEAGYIVDKRLEVVGNYDGSIKRGLNNYAVRVGKNMSAINIIGKPRLRVMTSTQGPVLNTNPILAFNRSHTLV